MRSLEQSICAAVLCLAAGSAAAQNNAVLQDPGQKSVRVVRTATPPVIDGDLSDAVWANAAVVDDLHQVTPVEYAMPDERTEVLILYDDDAMYVAARLYDTDPGAITARNMRQNASVPRAPPGKRRPMPMIAIGSAAGRIKRAPKSSSPWAPGH